MPRGVRSDARVDRTALGKIAAESDKTKIFDGAVFVVLGPHRNRRGRLLERVSAEDRAVVQLDGDFQIVETTFEQVAEWCGGEVEE